MTLRFALAGSAGRMGARVLVLAARDPSLRCVAALEASGSAAIGDDAGERAGLPRLGLTIGDRLDVDFDVLIDFSSPAGTDRWLQAALDRARPMVIGTTGHDEAQSRRIAEAARRIAVVKAANMSLGVTLLLGLVRDLARRLDPSYDVEIVETHHRRKVDAPSGTALAIHQAVREGRDSASPMVTSRSASTGERMSGEVGIHSLRMGEIVGEHVVHFAGPSETLTLTHTAHSRDCFAEGALRAACWIVGQPPGLHDMGQVLR